MAFYEKDFTSSEKVLIAHQWNLDKYIEAKLDNSQYFFCSLETFLAHLQEKKESDFQFLFTCLAYERGGKDEREQYFNTNFQFCSGESLLELEASNKHKDRSVCFMLRINRFNRMFICLMKLNEPDYELKNSSKFKHFPLPFDTNRIASTALKEKELTYAE